MRELRNALERVAVGLETLGRVPARSEVDLDGPFRLQKEKLIASSTAAKGT